MTIEQIPDRYRFSVVAHIFVDGASDAIKFYEKAFGATEMFRVSKPDGKIVHAEIKICDSVIMIGDAEGLFYSPKSLQGISVGLHVYVPNVDGLFEKAIAVGAKQIQQVQDMFYGDRMGMLEDPFGHVWVLLTHIENVEPHEIKRRGEMLLK